MFGSGYNPISAKAYAKHRREEASKPWGKKIYIFPKGFDLDKYKEFIFDENGNVIESVYNKLLEKSGFDKNIEKVRSEIAEELASLDWEISEKKSWVKDKFRNTQWETTEKIKTLSDEDLKRYSNKIEVLVGKEIQHPDYEQFWNDVNYFFKSCALLSS